MEEQVTLSTLFGTLRVSADSAVLGCFNGLEKSTF